MTSLKPWPSARKRLHTKPETCEFSELVVRLSSRCGLPLSIILLVYAIYLK